MILDTTAKTLEMVLGAAVATTELDYSFSWVDLNASTQEVTGEGESNGTSNGTSNVTMVAAPSSGTVRKIIEGTITNKDTVQATCTVNLYNGTTRRRKFKAILAVDDVIAYGVDK